MHTHRFLNSKGHIFLMPDKMYKHSDTSFFSPFKMQDLLYVIRHVNLHTLSRVYRWTGQNFDAVQDLPGTHPRAAVHFTVVTDTHFVAIASFMDNTGKDICIFNLHLVSDAVITCYTSSPTYTFL